MRKSFLAFVFLAISLLLFAQQTMNNDAVIKLAKAGLSDDLIVSTINAQPGTYDTSANGLIALKKAGASDKVVAAIVQKAAAPAAPAPLAPATVAPTPSPTTAAPTVPAAVDSVGVYFQSKDGSWQEVEAETVNMRTSGFMTKDMKGILKGGTSRRRLTLPVNMILDVPEGRSPGEYQLLRLEVHGDRREFHSVHIGWAHVSTGAAKNSLEFDPKKIAPRVYQFTLGQGFATGEYGIVPPSDTVSMGNMASN